MHERNIYDIPVILRTRAAIYKIIDIDLPKTFRYRRLTTSQFRACICTVSKKGEFLLYFPYFSHFDEH